MVIILLIIDLIILLSEFFMEDTSISNNPYYIEILKYTEILDENGSLNYTGIFNKIIDLLYFIFYEYPYLTPDLGGVFSNDLSDV